MVRSTGDVIDNVQPPVTVENRTPKKITKSLPTSPRCGEDGLLRNLAADGRTVTVRCTECPCWWRERDGEVTDERSNER
jgi:hypothetical protein